jgi:CubicO group peptidase (beta-lactamase class C family)
MVEGWCDDRFADVRAEFERCFTERGEFGASVCMTVDGQRVVDLWGGVADPASGRPWESDTVVLVWSSTKGATALCAHLLVDRGLLELEAPVARYWPEFAAAGKDGVTVGMVLSHQAGLPALRAPLPPGAFADWDRMVELLAAEEPFWEPGTRHGYHAFTFGWLVGEIVRRVSRRSLGRFFADEVAEPLGLDFWIGLPESVEPRLATLVRPDEPAPGTPVAPFFVAAMTDPGSIAALVLANHGGYMDVPDDRRYLAAEIPSAGGVTNARGLAGLYRPLALGGEVDGRRLIGDVTAARMGLTQSASAVDATLRAPTRFAYGFVKSVGDFGPADVLVLGDAAFGHVGSGGSIGFADPAERMSFGYAMNRLAFGTGLDGRGQSLVDAAYRSLGYRTREPGVWIR